MVNIVKRHVTVSVVDVILWMDPVFVNQDGREKSVIWVSPSQNSVL